jgi:hypothetical protein
MSLPFWYPTNRAAETGYSGRFASVSTQCNMNHMNRDGHIINKCVSNSFSVLELSLHGYNVRPYKRIARNAILLLFLDILTATYVGQLTRETEHMNCEMEELEREGA